MADPILDLFMQDVAAPLPPSDSGLPANVKAYMANAPSFAEGEKIAYAPGGMTAGGSMRAILDVEGQEQAAAAQQPASRTALLEQALNRARTRGSAYPNAIGDIASPREVPRGTYWPVDYTVTTPAPVPAGPQSFAAPVPPQSVSGFNQAVQQLNLTPQEQFLYQHHLNNLWNGGRVVQPGGDVSTVLQAVVQGPDGRFYNIPTVWGGQALPVDAAMRQAALTGWGNWPGYATPQAADARYLNDMHPVLERETAAWLAQTPNADPLRALMMHQQAAQHPLLQALDRLRQQQGQQ